MIGVYKTKQNEKYLNILKETFYTCKKEGIIELNKLFTRKTL